MGIREKFRRSARKSVPSDDNASHHSDAISSSPSSGASTPERSKSPSRLAKTLTWRSSKSTQADEEKREKKERKKREKSRQKVHPSERPLTETNLRHQEMLSGFTMTFGRQRGSFGSVSGISPMCSRQGSIDYEYSPYQEAY